MEPSPASLPFRPLTCEKTSASDYDCTYGKGSSLGYVRADGTSFAAALVSGAAALLRTQQPMWTTDEVTEQLTAKARDAGLPGRDRHYGWGLLDGNWVTTCDLRSSSTLYRRLVVARALSPSVPHTIQVRVRGTAGRPRVDVDAFVLLR
jgi:Subtilase family